MKRTLIAAAVLLCRAALPGAAHAEDGRHSYIVQLVDHPVASYGGQVTGLPATKSAKGQRLNVDTVEVQSYVSYLEQKKAAVLATVGAAQVTHNYNVVFNGFTALLSDDEVRALKKNSGVARISPDTILKADTSYTPTFLGLNRPGGLWEQVGGQGAAGEDIIIGIVDTGVWPENPSYADRVDKDGNPTRAGGTLAYGAPPARWKGACDIGEGFGADNCNNKLIGARYFNGTQMPLHWTEFASARDSLGGATGHGGHGTHTSTTAGGNAGVVATISGVAMGKLSGMAPRARIAAYKVCWTNSAGDNGCATSDSVAAIEQAVKDGVNVINYSIGPGGGGGYFDEPTELAFLGASNAGVFVSAAAGNEGPGTESPAPVSHPSPWLTTVGNSTHNRTYWGTATLGSGAKLSGASTNASTPSSTLILARDAGKAGVAADDPNLARCFGSVDAIAGVPDLLDPAKVAGKIVVCDRGQNVLVNKVANAKLAGAVGVILVNVAGGATTLPSQSYALSTLHLLLADGLTLKSYVAGGHASAALGDVTMRIDPGAPAPMMSDSSSRGPSVTDASILKPDLAAPGTDVLAGVSADLTPAQRDAVAGGAVAPRVDWAFYTGTSMATPHVTGMGAVLKQRHPDWSPAAIKSALMTTAFDTVPDGLSGGVPWDSSALNSGQLPWGQGAGQAAPSSAADPGLVYDAGEDDYIRFLCGEGSPAYSADTCQSLGSTAAYNLNLPSLTADRVLGSLTLNRTVTNVGGSAATYTAVATLPGFAVVVQPAVLTLAPGASAAFSVKLTRTTADVDSWDYGSLVWSDGAGHKVRSPLTARAATMTVKGEVYSEAATGSKILSIGTDFNGLMTAVKSGLQAATQASTGIGQYQGGDLAALALCAGKGGPGVNVTDVTIPAGALLARFALFDADTSDSGESDLDLALVDPFGDLMYYSYGDTANEAIQVWVPAPGTYKVCVLGYAPKNGHADYKLSSWLLMPGVMGGNLKVTLPGLSRKGGTGTVGMSWSGLETGKRYLGEVDYMLGVAHYASTLIDVDTTDPLPMAHNRRSKPALPAR
ncbi:S8 family peptidase [Rugamonas sp.]|uniref:S8 family peptidase n=1 Tax=Rugamonas sp. TaxID=1926287 RepID=UPI0025D2390A|nr:S8 family peptidase [Rugamonas sp.]